jgi:hypothetical protein
VRIGGNGAAQEVDNSVKCMMILNSREKDLEKLRYRLNLLLIAGLCSTTLAPCVIFYFRGEGDYRWMLVFIGISYLISRLPNSFYDKLQVSSDLKFYKKLGVHQFKKFSTNGDFINKRIRRSFPAHRNVADLQTIKDKLNETYVIERSHTVLFAFCLLTNVYAFLTDSLGTAFILLIGNVVFNFYPNLLQQYNRIRYMRVVDNFS